MFENQLSFLLELVNIQKAKRESEAVKEDVLLLKDCLWNLLMIDPGTVTFGMEMNMMNTLMCLISEWGCQTLLGYSLRSQYVY